MSARIFSPAKTAMQSGKARTGKWTLEFDRATPRRIEPLMGYTSSSDMKTQVRLTFETRDAAVAYAERHGIAYRIEEPNRPERRRQAYADNFRFDRRVPWTH